MYIETFVAIIIIIGIIMIMFPELILLLLEFILNLFSKSFFNSGPNIREATIVDKQRVLYKTIYKKYNILVTETVYVKLDDKTYSKDLFLDSVKEIYKAHLYIKDNKVVKNHTDISSLPVDTELTSDKIAKLISTNFNTKWK